MRNRPRHNVSRVRSRDTQPELAVRSALRTMGLRPLATETGLPSKPDAVLNASRTAVFVHGCFWHRHQGCRFAYTPKSNVHFWTTKFAANVRRDARVARKLRRLGWRVITVWECQTWDRDKLVRLLRGRLRLSP